MKKALIIIGALLGLIVVALLVAPIFIPVETFKSQILAQIEKATGRKAAIDGDFSIALLPRAKITASKFSLANAAGGKAPNIVSLEKLNVRIGILPLLSGTIAIDSFVLDKPVISLEVDAQGRANWAFAPAGATPGAASDASPKESGGSALPLDDLELGDVRLVDGRIAYSDARSGASYVIDDINMTVSLPSLSSPMKVDGSLVYNREKIAIALGVAKPDALIAGEMTALEATIGSNPVTLSFKGEATNATVLKATGTLDLDVPSVRQLAAWAGKPLAMPGEGLGPLKIAGRVSVDGKKYGFTGAKLALDSIRGSGDFRFDGGGRIPYINAQLDLATLDLNPYLASEPGAPGKTQPASGDATTQPAPGAAKAPAGWSTDPIDVGPLRLVNADANINVEGILMQKITIGKSQVKLALKDGRLAVDLAEMALYDGNGTANLKVDGAGTTPGVEAAFNLSGLSARPALQDAIAFDRIEGTLATDLKIETKGKSQKAMISALNGQGDVKFLNGTIRGINIGAMIRNAKSAFLDPKAREQQKTDFAELSGTFTIRNGIVSNNDLSLLSPLLRVAGKGTVDLPQQSLNYRIEPRLAATSQGQGGKADASGIEVPVIASGPWSNITYRPDLSGVIEGIAKDPEKALEGIKGAIPGGSGGSGNSESQVPADPGKTLKKLFGR